MSKRHLLIPFGEVKVTDISSLHSTSSSVQGRSYLWNVATFFSLWKTLQIYRDPSDFGTVSIRLWDSSFNLSHSIFCITAILQASKIREGGQHKMMPWGLNVFINYSSVIWYSREYVSLLIQEFLGVLLLGRQKFQPKLGFLLWRKG